MYFFKKKKEKVEYPIRTVSLQEIRDAINEFSKNLQKGVYLSIIVKEDNTIDYGMLKHYMNYPPPNHNGY